MTTASSTTHRKWARIASMESLGFLEAPYDSSRTRTVRPQGAHAAPVTMPHIPEPSPRVGRHTKAGPSIEDVLSTTLIDLAPQETSRRLGRRDTRWTMVLLLVCSLGVAAAGGYWIWQRPAQIESNAAVGVDTDLNALAAALDDTQEVAEQLATEETVADYTQVLNAAEASARDLFTSAAALPQSDPTRAMAADGASAVLDYTGQMNAAIAFRGALEPALIMPDLISEPDGVDLAEAAAAFGDWRAHLDDVAEALPEGVNAELSAHFDNFRISLSNAQTTYLDSLREHDAAATRFILRSLAGDLDDIAEELRETYVGLSDALVTSIEVTRRDLSDLVG